MIDPSRPWASAVPELARKRIEADLERRDHAALARAKAKAAERGERIIGHGVDLPEDLAELRKLAGTPQDAEAAIAINSAIVSRDETVSSP